MWAILKLPLMDIIKDILLKLRSMHCEKYLILDILILFMALSMLLLVVLVFSQEVLFRFSFNDDL